MNFIPWHRKKETNFFGYVDELQNDAEHSVRTELAQLDGEFAKSGALGGSRHWLVIQQTLLNSLDQYVNTLSERVTKYDPQNSPIKAEDFDTAIYSVRSFGERIKEIYKEKDHKAGRFKGSVLNFDENQLSRRLLLGTQRLKEEKAVFNSERSFWKWAWGDLRRRVWSGGLMVFGIVIGELFDVLPPFK